MVCVVTVITQTELCAVVMAVGDRDQSNLFLYTRQQ